MNMAGTKLTDGEIDISINLWHNEHVLWDSSQLLYRNADARQATLSRISEQLSGVDIGTYIC